MHPEHISEQEAVCESSTIRSSLFEKEWDMFSSLDWKDLGS